VINDDLDIGRTKGRFGPLEANPPFVVDTDAELTRTVAIERFQSIAVECCKIL
jgi:hypothetical protein